MQGWKPIKVYIPVGTKLSNEQHPKTHEEIDYMTHVPCASVVSSLMYAMVTTWLDITHAVGVLIWSMLTRKKDYVICYEWKLETNIKYMHMA